MYRFRIKVAQAGAPLFDPVTKTWGESSVGHIWYEIEDGTTGRVQSFGFAPVWHGFPAGAWQVYDDDTKNYVQIAYMGEGNSHFSSTKYLQILQKTLSIMDLIKKFILAGSRTV